MTSGIKNLRHQRKKKKLRWNRYYGIVELLCVALVVLKRIGIPLSAWHFLNLPGISLKNVEKK